MKIIIARMQHETNTFSPVPTPLEAFGPNGPYFGRAAYEALKGTRTQMGAYLDIAENLKAEIVTPVAAYAPPSGAVDATAYETMCGAMLDAIGKGCDAIMLDLHGAMVTQTTDDGEGTLLQRIRQIAPRTPLCVALDLHGNLTDTIVRNCDVLTGYKTYPHVDMYEAGDLAGKILLRYMKGEVKPVMAWGSRPILAQTLRMCTEEYPMQDFVGAARAAEQRGMLAASAFGGFPQTDIPDMGVSAVVVADGDRAAAETECQRMLDIAWERRADLIYHAEPLEQSIARAKQYSEGPVLLLDHCDNCASGATQDVMLVLREALRQGLTDIGVGPVRDAESVARCIAVGVGAKLTLQLGGKTDMPSINEKGEPLEVSGTVRAITDGEYTIHGPQLTGMRACMGRTAVLDTGYAEIVITERLQEPWDLGVFTSVGIDPRRKKYLLLKSRMYYRPIFLPIAKAAIECNGVGVGTSDYWKFPFKKMKRPMYPLDKDDEFHR
jgi:microcystin degradation protein MlrC